MSKPFILIGAIVAIGLVYVAIPMAVEAYRHWVRPRIVTCPHQHVAAEVTVKPWRAALTSLIRKPSLAVKSCTYWPECHGCDESCRDEL